MNYADQITTARVLTDKARQELYTNQQKIERPKMFQTEAPLELHEETKPQSNGNGNGNHKPKPISLEDYDDIELEVEEVVGFY